MEKLFPISINTDFCIRCQKCTYSCHSKAIFFRDTIRYVDYNKCKGCLKCVEVCEHNAIIVIDMDDGILSDFEIDNEKCKLCKECLKPDFCLQNLFSIQKDPTTNVEKIIFNKSDMEYCEKCLKCVKDCPYNAIIPIIG